MTIKEALKIVSMGGVGYTIKEYEEAKSTIIKNLEHLEVLEEENQELKEQLEIEKFENFIVFREQNVKLKKAIEILKGYLSVSNEVDFDTYFTSQLEDEKQELLKEVL